MRYINVIQGILQITIRKIIRHAKIHIQIVSAVLWRGTRYIAPKIPDKFKHFNH